MVKTSYFRHDRDNPFIRHRKCRVYIFHGKCLRVTHFDAILFQFLSFSEMSYRPLLESVNMLQKETGSCRICTSTADGFPRMMVKSRLLIHITLILKDKHIVCSLKKIN